VETMRRKTGGGLEEEIITSESAYYALRHDILSALNIISKSNNFNNLTRLLITTITMLTIIIARVTFKRNWRAKQIKTKSQD